MRYEDLDDAIAGAARIRGQATAESMRCQRAAGKLLILLGAK